MQYLTCFILHIRNTIGFTVHIKKCIVYNFQTNEMLHERLTSLFLPKFIYGDIPCKI